MKKVSSLGFLRSFFSYTSPEPLPEVPKEEPPDPNADRSLSEPFRAARKILVAACAVSLAWSTAQFGLDDLRIVTLGLSVDLGYAAVPLMLGVTLVYLIVRWIHEFAMMPRHIRRWPLAQLDFKLVSLLARFSLLAVAAGAMDRSLRSVFWLLIVILAVVCLCVALVALLMFITMPVRMWARERANRPSAASAVNEAFAWSVFFATCLTAISIVSLGVASYRYQPLRGIVWQAPPEPTALASFLIVFLALFLGHWILRPMMARLFAERPPYFTERTEDGRLAIQFVKRDKEPLL